MALDIPGIVRPALPIVCSGQLLTRVQWQPDRQNAYSTALTGVAASPLAACRQAAMDGHVDAAFSHLDTGVRAAAAASTMPSRAMAGSSGNFPRVHAPYFDAQCRELLKHMRAFARHGGRPIYIERVRACLSF